MTKEMWIIVLGIVVALVPFLGFPGSWKTVIFVLVGLAIAVLAFIIRLRRMTQMRNALSTKGRQTDSYVENDIRVESRNNKGYESARIQGKVDA